jgi:hypothetical protein
MKVYQWSYSERFCVLESADEADQFKLSKFTDMTRLDSDFEILVRYVSDDKGRIGEVADFAVTTGFTRVISESAFNVIGEILNRYGLVFPLRDVGSGRRWFLYRCNNVCDCLDREKSIMVETVVNGKQKVVLNKAAFHTEAIVGDVFLIPELACMGHQIFVTENFKSVIKKAKLKGLVLEAADMAGKQWVS